MRIFRATKPLFERFHAFSCWRANSTRWRRASCSRVAFTYAPATFRSGGTTTFVLGASTALSGARRIANSAFGSRRTAHVSPLRGSATSLNRSDHVRLDAWLERNFLYGVYDRRISRLHPEVDLADPVAPATSSRSIRYLARSSPWRWSLLRWARSSRASLLAAATSVDRLGAERLGIAGSHALLWARSIFSRSADGRRIDVGESQGLWPVCLPSAQSQSIVTSITLMESRREGPALQATPVEGSRVLRTRFYPLQKHTLSLSRGGRTEFKSTRACARTSGCRFNAMRTRCFDEASRDAKSETPSAAVVGTREFFRSGHLCRRSFDMRGTPRRRAKPEGGMSNRTPTITALARSDRGSFCGSQATAHVRFAAEVPLPDGDSETRIIVRDPCLHARNESYGVSLIQDSVLVGRASLARACFECGAPRYALVAVFP